MMQFQKATKRQARLRLALIGPSGSGKTYTALTLAPALGERVAVIDTEHGSASKYADMFAFDTLELDTFGPQTYVEAIKAAEAAGYDVLIIDSLSHAWIGKDGALEQVDRATARSQSKNSYTAWRDVTPVHNALIDAMVQSPCHIIATMRTKTEYVIETNDKGKQVPRKVGLAPIQRDGVEYEFDVVADMTIDNRLIVSKTRCSSLNGAMIDRPGIDLGKSLAAWLTDGAQPLPPAQVTKAAPPEPPAHAMPKPNGGNFNPVFHLVEIGVCENNPAASSLLNHHVPANIKTDKEALTKWGKIYRGWRDMGSPIEGAVKNANEGIEPVS